MDARLVMPRRTRTLGAVGTGLLAVLLAWSPVLAAVSWGTTHKASTDYAYGWSDALTRTVTSTGTAYLHTIATRDVVGGDQVTNTGPYLGVYYRRGNAGGSAWGTLKRLNASNEHADYGTIASSGKYVYDDVAAPAARSAPPTIRAGAPRPPVHAQHEPRVEHGYWKPRERPIPGRELHRPAVDHGVRARRVYITYTGLVGRRDQAPAQRGLRDDRGSYLGAIGATNAATMGRAVLGHARRRRDREHGRR